MPPPLSQHKPRDFFPSRAFDPDVTPPAADPVALGLFERHGRAVRRFLFRFTRDRAAADDLAGEVFLRVVKASETYQPREREAAWIFRIAQNVLRDAHRRRNRSVEHAVAADAAAPAGQVASLDLERGLDALPEDERVALLLGEMGGLSYAEIADVTASTVPAVRSRIYRARQTLRARLLPPSREAAFSVRGTDDD
jgi:RNA polymerase sigma-70 factor, ECF subfamily